MLSRGGVKARQLIIDDNTMEPKPAEGQIALSSAELIVKANIALEAIQSDSTPNAKVVAVTKLCNGGVLFEFNDRCITDKLWDDTNMREQFIAHYSATATIKP